MTKFLVDLQPVGRRIEVEPGINLLEAAQKGGVDLVAACGGIGICGTCKVRLVKGQLTPLSLTEEELLSPDEIAQGVRMACQAEPLSDLKLEIPRESLPAIQQMQIDGREEAVALDPAVVAIDLSLAAPDLHDLRSDLTRVQQALAERGHPPLRGDLPALARLSPRLREQNWSLRLAVRPLPGSLELVNVLPPGAPLLGLAADMGSTKLAVYLVDLSSGATLARVGVMNPQIAYGEDVVSRIAFADRSEENRILLQTRLVETFNQVIADLCAEISVGEGGVCAEQVVDAVVVGNTAMHHFFTALPVSQLGASPYVPAVSQPLDVRAADLGLNIAPGAHVHLPANIAGYVGGDHTSCLLTLQSFPLDQNLVLVDIGTNTEISLVAGRQRIPDKGSAPSGEGGAPIFSCSCASGPAFEGAHIRDGMRAAPGAVERVRIRAGMPLVRTIGDLPAVGICGSGILEVVAELTGAGVVDPRGVLRRDRPGVRLDGNNRAEYLLVPAAQTGHGRDVIVTRKDIHEIQLAKGAIRAGIEILLGHAGIAAGEVDAWIIAGAFGTYLDLDAAQRIGMFPRQPLERFHQVGNAAGVGAKQMLLSRQARLLANQIIERVSYIELTVQPEFTDVYVGALELT
jgi:uncharacterized 2Fe-2S/4Fe-4S cluster protein (DUF4445 family)